MQPRLLPEQKATDPLPEVPMTFVWSELDGNVHVFVPESFSFNLVQTIASNFSRRIQQPVKVFHDTYRQKYRLCPLPESSLIDSSIYGKQCFSCDLTTLKLPQQSKTTFADFNFEDENSEHIPRPRNRWILYRQHKSKALREEFPGITASELSKVISSMWKNESPTGKRSWYEMEQAEEVKHKKLYPDYKYTIKRVTKKPRKKAKNGAILCRKLLEGEGN